MIPWHQVNCLTRSFWFLILLVEQALIATLEKSIYSTGKRDQPEMPFALKFPLVLNIKKHKTWF